MRKLLPVSTDGRLLGPVTGPWVCSRWSCSAYLSSCVGRERIQGGLWHPSEQCWPCGALHTAFPFLPTNWDPRTDEALKHVLLHHSEPPAPVPLHVSEQQSLYSHMGSPDQMCGSCSVSDPLGVYWGPGRAMTVRVAVWAQLCMWVPLLLS